MGQHKRIRSGVKKEGRIEGRIRNKTFKIKQLIAVPKNVQVKKTGHAVQRMTVHRKVIIPPERHRAEY